MHYRTSPPFQIILESERDVLDVVRIHLLKLSAEFVQHAAEYIHPTNSNRRQGRQCHSTYYLVQMSTTWNLIGCNPWQP